MQKWVLLLVCLVFAWSNEISIQDIKCESANKEVCGYNSWECFGEKCLIQKSKNMEQAFKIYFEYLIQNQKRLSRKYGEPEEKNLSLYLYQTMKNFSLPKIGESVEKHKYRDGDKDGYPSCHCTIKRTEKDLTLEFNRCQSEENIIIFKQEENGFKITYSREIM